MREYIKEILGLIIGSFGLLFPIVTGMWTYFAGICVGIGLMLICFNVLDFCVCKKCKKRKNETKTLI